MNIAHLIQQRVLASIGRQFDRWFTLPPSEPKGASAHSVGSTYAPDLIAARRQSTRASGQNGSNFSTKPLRVVRVLDAEQSHGSVGRMVISGRMADVCAELDRLAAREAALA